MLAEPRPFQKSQKKSNAANRMRNLLDHLMSSLLVSCTVLCQLSARKLFYIKYKAERNSAYLYDWLPAQHVVAQINHSISWHSCWWCVSNVVHFEEYLAVIGQRDPVAVWQRQRSAFVKKSVQVFSPGRIDRTIKNQPDMLTFYTAIAADTA